MKFPSKKHITFGITLLTLSFGTSCGKKGQLEYQAAQMKLSLTEQTSALKKIQADSAALGNLGFYNTPQASHLDQLRAKIKSLREETQNLTAEKQSAINDIALIQKELDAYRSRYVR
jgi:hypothetical protein